MGNRKSTLARFARILRFAIWPLAAALVIGACLLAPSGMHLMPTARADSYSYQMRGLFPHIFDRPTISITTATASTGATPTSGVSSAQIQWLFGTVAGMFGTCTVQAQTSYDGTNFLTLGNAVSVTVSTSTLNAWTLLAEAPSNSVTTSSASSSAALGFGSVTQYVFACSSYGTSAPVSISVLYE